MIYLQLKGIVFEENWSGEYVHECIINDFDYLVIIPIIIEKEIKGYGIFNTKTSTNIFIHASREVVSKVLFTIADLMSRVAYLENKESDTAVIEVQDVGIVKYIY